MLIYKNVCKYVNIIWHHIQDIPCSCSPPLPVQTLPWPVQGWFQIWINYSLGTLSKTSPAVAAITSQCKPSPDQSKVDSNLTKSPSWHSVQDTPCSCSPPLPAQTLPQNGACGSREDLTEPDTCPKQNRSAIFVEKRRLRQPGRPHRAQYM